MRVLDVYLHRDLTGSLIQDDDGEMLFEYQPAWVDNPAAIPLSHSLPLQKEHFTRKQCSGFFGGLLPEEGQREVIASNLGISARNDFAMLEGIGGECAGAVTFIPHGQPLPQNDHSYSLLTSESLATLIRELPRRPLLAGDGDVRLSLAGAQNKTAVYVTDHTVSKPLGGAPSTHILKPGNVHYEGLIFNEAFCMRLAEAVGLPVAPVAVRHADQIPYLLVERYDRKIITAPEGTHIHRLHQEDFCQAMAIGPKLKYQNEGGPSIARCVELLRTISSAPVIDLQHFLDAVIFNFIIGNHDAHGKNFSLLYHESPNGLEIRMAPLYDLVSTVYYPDLSKNMAMKIGAQYHSELVIPQDFERLAEETGFAKPFVKRRVAELAEIIRGKAGQGDIDHAVATAVAAIIDRRCEETLQRFKD